MSMPLTFTEAELMEIVEFGEAHANITRGYAEKARQATRREYHGGVADGSASITKRLREMIEAKRPLPSIRLVARGGEAAHG